MATSSPTITIQRHKGTESVFKVGEAAAQLHTKLDHCVLWEEDLSRWAGVATTTGLCSIGLAAYCVAVVDPTVWPVVMMQAVFVALGPLWWFAGWRKTERALKWSLYLTMVSIILAVGSALLWMTIYQTVRDQVVWLWWVLLAVQLVQVLTVLCATKSLANIYDTRLVVDLNVNLHRAVEKQTKSVRSLGLDTATQLTSGATALAAAGSTTPTDAARVDPATKNK